MKLEKKIVTPHTAILLLLKLESIMRAKKLFVFFLLSLCSLCLFSAQVAPTPAQTEVAPAPAKEAPTAPAPAPSSHVEPHTVLDQPAVSYESAFFKMLLTLGGLILLVFLTIWILRRLSQGKFGSGGASRTIHILEKRPLSAKSMLYLVQIGSKQVLISESQFEVRKIASLEEITDDA